MLVGELGFGKRSLLAALLPELNAQSGYVSIAGKLCAITEGRHRLSKHRLLARPGALVMLVGEMGKRFLLSALQAS